MFVITADGVSEKLIFAEIAFLLYCRILYWFSLSGLKHGSRAGSLRLPGCDVLFPLKARGVPLGLDKNYCLFINMLTRGCR